MNPEGKGNNEPDLDEDPVTEKDPGDYNDPDFGSEYPSTKPNHGSMAGSVGIGKYAKTNIIWYIVSASFIAFSCIASAFIIMTIYGYNVEKLSESIKDMWGIFTPVLTLSLGYLFGKEKKKSSDKKDIDIGVEKKQE